MGAINLVMVSSPLRMTHGAHSSLKSRESITFVNSRIRATALALPNVQRAIGNNQVKKIIVVPDRIINVVL